VTAWFVAKSLLASRFKLQAEQEAMERYGLIARQEVATQFQWIGCCRRMKSWPKYRGWRPKNVKLRRRAHLFVLTERLSGLIKNTAVLPRDCASSHSCSSTLLEGGVSPAPAGLSPGPGPRTVRKLSGGF